MLQFRPLTDNARSTPSLSSLTKSSSHSSTSTDHNNGDNHTPKFQKSSSASISQEINVNIGKIALQYLDAYRKGNEQAGKLFVTALISLSFPSSMDKSSSLSSSSSSIVPPAVVVQPQNQFVSSSTVSSPVLPSSMIITRSTHKNTVELLDVAIAFVDEGSIDIALPILRWIHQFVTFYPSVRVQLFSTATFVITLCKLLDKWCTVIKETNPRLDPSTSPITTPMASPIVTSSSPSSSVSAPSSTDDTAIPPSLNRPSRSTPSSSSLVIKLTQPYEELLLILIELLSTSVTYHIQLDKFQRPKKYSNPSVKYPSVPLLRELAEKGIVHSLFEVLALTGPALRAVTGDNVSSSNVQTDSSPVPITPSTNGVVATNVTNVLSLDKLYKINLQCTECLNDIFEDSFFTPTRINSLFFGSSDSGSRNRSSSKPSSSHSSRKTVNFLYFHALFDRFPNKWIKTTDKTLPSSDQPSLQFMIGSLVRNSLTILYIVCRTKSFYSNGSATIPVHDNLLNLVPYLASIITCVVNYYTENLTTTASSPIVRKPILTDHVLVPPNTPNTDRTVSTVDQSLLFLGDIGALTMACLTAMCNRGSEESVQPSIPLTSVITLLNYPHIDVQSWIICYLGWLCYGDETVTEEITTSGVLPKLCELLYHPSIKLRSDAAWTLSNLATGSSSYALAIMAVPNSLKLIFNAYLTDHLIVRYDIIQLIESIMENIPSEKLTVLLEEGLINVLGNIFRYPLSPYSSQKLAMVMGKSEFFDTQQDSKDNDNADEDEEVYDDDDDGLGDPDPECYATKIASRCLKLLEYLRKNDNSSMAELFMVTENIPQIIAEYLKITVSLGYGTNEIQVTNMTTLRDTAFSFLRRYFREAIPPNFVNLASASQSKKKNADIVPRRSVYQDRSLNRFGGGQPTLYRTSESNVIPSTDDGDEDLSDPFSPSTVRYIADQTQRPVHEVLEALNSTGGDIEATFDYLVKNSNNSENEIENSSNRLRSLDQYLLPERL